MNADFIWPTIQWIVTVAVIPLTIMVFSTLRQHDRDILRMLTILDERNKRHDVERDDMRAVLQEIRDTMKELRGAIRRLDREKADKE